MATRSKKSQKKSLTARAAERFKNFRERRPHRTLRRTRRRDYVRPLKLPGMISFTNHVFRTFWSYKKHLLGLALVAAVVSLILIGIGSQETYQTLVDVLKETGGEAFEGGWGEIEKAVLLLASVATIGVDGGLGEGQQAYVVLVSLFVWMTTVWLLRNLLANREVKLRDALYSASAPMLATFVLALVLVVQLLPAGLAALGYSAASVSGLLSGGGVEAMLFWVAAGALLLISLFWIMSTLFAMVIATLPGTYPFKALAIAGDMVLGRRTKILLRILWMLLCVTLVWVAVLVPIILFDGWLKSVWEGLAWLPLVPLFVLVMTSVTMVWVSTYIYLLYRKIVDEDAKHE